MFMISSFASYDRRFERPSLFAGLGRGEAH
jgi:hypothetical protein